MKNWTLTHTWRRWAWPGPTQACFPRPIPIRTRSTATARPTVSTPSPVRGAGQHRSSRAIPIKVSVTDPALIDALNDSRALRQEREQLRTQFHPDDPYRDRPIQASPWLFTDAG